MRRVLIALAIVASFAFSAAPAVAQEGSDAPSETVTPSQTTEPTQDPPPPPPEETTPPPPVEETTPPPVVDSPSPTQTPGTGQNSGSDQGSGAGGSTPGAAKLSNSQADPVDQLGDTAVGKTVKVCHDSGSGTYTTGHVGAASVLDGSAVAEGDIVKPFKFNGGGFAGLNWDTGKSVYNNGCTAPSDAPAPGSGATTEICEPDTSIEDVTLDLVAEGGTEGASAETPSAGCEDAIEAAVVVKKVTICHARAADTNPYGPKAITVSVNSIFKPNGHGTHTGGVFPTPGWGDIIPPFDHEGGSYPGLNWSAEGQEIFFNKCQAPGDEPPVKQKVDICHATAADTNPYGPKAINVSVNSIIKPNGHGTHTGGVFPTPGWGDIIPPFDHEGGSFPGLNWSAEGQEIFFNDCQIADEPPVKQKVDICHARAAVNNPYGPKAINVSVNSIIKPNGHGTHTGGVFPTPGWGDIIPPFDHEGGSFPGLNWSAEGQAIFFNDCQIADEPPVKQKVDICHARSSQTNPYGPGPINVSVNSIIKPNGHGTHTGPVFFPDAQDWGDIIPPFDHEGGSFPGLNWTPEGQAIFFNDCQIPDDEEPCPEDSEDEECDEDDDECEEDCDDDDRDKAALLPSTGGGSLWTLLMGGLLTVLGTLILTNRAAMGLNGLIGAVPAEASAAAWQHTTSLTVPAASSWSPHRGRWTALSVLCCWARPSSDSAPKSSRTCQSSAVTMWRRAASTSTSGW